jgi:DNA replication and repair protein RecF
LLDEVAAHLDALRRAALADEIAALGLQAFLTGTDERCSTPSRVRPLASAWTPAGLTVLDAE